MKTSSRRKRENIVDYAMRLQRAGAFDHRFPEHARAHAKLSRALEREAAARRLPDDGPYLVYRRVWLEPVIAKQLVQIEPGEFVQIELDHPPAIRMETRGPFGPDQPHPPKPKGFTLETYANFVDAALACRRSVEEQAVARWADDLSQQRRQRSRRQRRQQQNKTGRAETISERNQRHRWQWVKSGLSKRAYALQHDGEDALDAERIRRLLANPAHKSRPRVVRNA